MQRRAEPDNWNEFPLSPNLMRESKFRGPVPKRNLFGADSDVKGQSTVIHCMATISATPANILSGAANGASSGGQRDADSNSAQQPGVQKKSMGTRQLFAGMMPTQQQMEAFFSTAEEKVNINRVYSLLHALPL